MARNVLKLADDLELDRGAYELRRSGEALRLSRIPMELLLLLVERRGELVTRNEIVERTTKDFMKKIGYRGILDIGYRYDARDGGYKVLDINPRIGATFRLFVATNGMDVARAAYLDLTGQRVPRSESNEGRKWFVEDRDIVSSMRYFRDRKLNLKQWIASFEGVQESAWFAKDDLLPFFIMCGQFVGTSFSAPQRRR